MSQHIFVVTERATWAPPEEDRDYYAPGSIGNIPCVVEEVGVMDTSKGQQRTAWVRLNNGTRVGVMMRELRIAK